MNNSAIQTEALNRARGGQSMGNYATIFAGFAAKGIAADDIKPRENVLTFHAWKALGRVVKKGEHGVKVCTFVNAARDDDSGKTKPIRKMKAATVFHISQTEEMH